MTINAIEELEKRGYVFSLTESGMIFRYCGDSVFEGFSAEVAPFFDRIRHNKAAAIEFLRSRRKPEIVKLVDLHEWLEANHARLVGPAVMDLDGMITVTAVDL